MKLPSILGGARRWRVIRLVGYGLAHAAAAFGLAVLARHGLHGTTGARAAWPITLGILGLTGMLFVLRMLEARDAEALGQDYVNRVRRRILRRILRAAGGRRGIPRWGVTMSRLVTDLNSLRNWVSLGLARMISSGVAVAGLLVSLALFHLPTALIMLGVLGAVLGASTLLVPPLRRWVREVRRLRGRLANQVGEQVLTARTIWHLGREDQALHGAFRNGKRLRDAMVRRAGLAAMLRRGPELGHGLALVGLLWVVASPTLPPLEGAGSAAVVLFLIGLVVAAARDLARAWDYRIAFSEGHRRIAGLLGGVTPLVPAGGQALAGNRPVGVTLEAVQWWEQQVPWSFEAAAGERIVIVGPSGAGKSMLLRMVARWRDPAGGRVLLDGVPLSEVRDLHRVVQLVSAEVPLLRGTVRSNLGYGLNPEGALRVADVAGVLGMVEESALFPEGLETRVAEGGSNLSAGARARTLLGRAVLANPRLLLVDDASFLIDGATGRALRETLELVRATVLLVGAERSWPIVPDAIWRLSPAGACIERLLTAPAAVAGRAAC